MNEVVIKRELAEATQRNSVLVRVKGSFTRVINVVF